MVETHTVPLTVGIERDRVQQTQMTEKLSNCLEKERR